MFRHKTGQTLFELLYFLVVLSGAICVGFYVSGHFGLLSGFAAGLASVGGILAAIWIILFIYSSITRHIWRHNQRKRNIERGLLTPNKPVEPTC